MKTPCKFTTPPRDRYIGLLTGHALKARDRLNFYKWMATYGDYTHFKLGPMSVYLFTDPDAVNYILKKNARNYTKNTPAYKIVDRVTGKGIFTESEASWLRIRKIAQPFFTQSQTGHWEKIVEKVALDLEVILHEIEKKGDAYNFSPLMTKLTLRVLGESIFDKDLGVAADVFDRELKQLIFLTNEMITQKMSFNFFKKMSSERKFRASMLILDTLISKLVDEAKSEVNHNPNNMIHSFLKAPYEINQQFLIDQVKTMAFAGHETTSTVLSWALHFLSIYPDWQEKILLELNSLFPNGILKAAEIGQCQNLDIFINETIRMYPPAWAFARRAIDDDTIEGYTIKAQSIVTVSPYLLGHDQRYWIHPSEFNPNRFIDTEHVKLRHAYSFIPFGLGPRACIGERLSRLELNMIIATFIKDFKLLAVNPNIEMEATLTLALKNGIQLRLIKRI